MQSLVGPILFSMSLLWNIIEIKCFLGAYTEIIVHSVDFFLVSTSSELGVELFMSSGHQTNVFGKTFPQHKNVAFAHVSDQP